MSEASDKHDEQCANLKKAAAICEQRGQGLVDSVIALQAEVDALTKVMEAARDDLLMRGDIDSQGCRVVNMSATTWDNFCDAIDNAALSQEGE